jgi:acetate kinase
VRIAVLNAGSSTVKVALYDVPSGGDTAEAARLAGAGRELGSGDTPRDAFRAALEEIGAAAAEVEAIGHRVVHGGRIFAAPVRVDAEVERGIEALAHLAPQHNPAALEGIRLGQELFPGRPAVAVFDTAFHLGRAPESVRYAIPWELGESMGLLRYGFHGIAHASLVQSVAAAERGAVGEVVGVTLQLGAGCSACAVDGGRSIETSMGFSPLEGLVMATRSGDIDPAVVLELLDRGRTATEVRALLSRGSGLEGLAGNADLRRVLAAEAEGDERARVAVGLFVRRIVMRVGAYLTLLGGRGSLTFGGGIGTHSAEIRQRVADGLVAWNVALDPERNREAGVRGPIGRPGSRPVYVFETDEERLIAVETRALLRPSGPDGPRPVDPSPDPSP